MEEWENSGIIPFPAYYATPFKNGVDGCSYSGQGAAVNRIIAHGKI